jgi:hypothetical protein
MRFKFFKQNANAKYGILFHSLPISEDGNEKKKKICFFFSKKIESSFVTLLIEKTDMINSPYPLHGYTCTCILGSSGEVYWIQHYVIKFVSNLRKVVWFSPGTLVSSTNKTDCNDLTEILLNVALNTINLT